ncbi:MAG: molybdenum cofactor biosynthesis protein MoaE [Aeromicrobium sp.]|uniref:molybdenum cofactor biosynthesis protein MoaE n=1 Tax=Aeromicrobium sp. TaxID=1871063 RepID=UPI003C6BCCE0
MPIVRLLDIRDAPLSLDEVYHAVSDSSSGGTCLFIGTVRDHDGGDPVSDLSYSSHPTALDRLRDVAERIGTEEDVVALAATHRIGDLAVGDIAVVVGASAGHRPAAFSACRRLIDELKLEVPVWKQQTFASGDQAWL